MSGTGGCTARDETLMPRRPVARFVPWPEWLPAAVTRPLCEGCGSDEAGHPRRGIRACFYDRRYDLALCARCALKATGLPVPGGHAWRISRKGREGGDAKKERTRLMLERMVTDSWA